MPWPGRNDISLAGNQLPYEEVHTQPSQANSQEAQTSLKKNGKPFGNFLTKKERNNTMKERNKGKEEKRQQKKMTGKCKNEREESHQHGSVVER